jgi:ribonuclease T
MQPATTPQLKDRFRKFLPVVVDVETGGFDPQIHALVEIAVVTLRMNEQGQLQLDERLAFQINPPASLKIDSDAIKFLGYDPRASGRTTVSELVAFAEIRKLIKKATEEAGCTRAILVGHNAHFDLGFVQAGFERTKLSTPFHKFSTLDTVSMGALVYGQTVLAKLCEVAGMDWDHQQAHSALYDTEQTARLFCKMVNRFPSALHPASSAGDPSARPALGHA